MDGPASEGSHVVAQPHSALWAWAFDGVLVLLLVAGVAFVGFKGVPELRQAHAEGVVPITQLKLIGRPAWFDDSVARPVAVYLRENIQSGGVSHETLALARTMLERTGWFDAVRQVRLEAGAIVVEADYATPCALVEHGDREWLVGSRGQRMPSDFARGAGPRLVRIRGVGESTPELAGEPWKSPSLDQALQLIALLEGHAWFSEIAWIDVSGANGDALRFGTRGGTEFLWGSAPDAYQPGHIPPQQRVAVLDTLAHTFGSLDRTGYRLIDLTLDFTLGQSTAPAQSGAPAAARSR